MAGSWNATPQFAASREDYTNAAIYLTITGYLRPLSRDEMVQLGDIYDLTGQTAQAVQALEQALAAGPESGLRAEICFRLGSCREKVADRAGALAAYAQAVACPSSMPGNATQNSSPP